MIKIYPITPMGAPRMTRADAWNKRDVVLRYRAFKDLVQAHKVELANGYSVTFVLPMPPSWSKKKRDAMRGQYHQYKPDLDNLLKALMDSIFGEDCHIADLGRVKKVWGDSGQIKIEQERLISQEAYDKGLSDLKQACTCGKTAEYIKLFGLDQPGMVGPYERETILERLAGCMCR